MSEKLAYELPCLWLPSNKAEIGIRYLVSWIEGGEVAVSTFTDYGWICEVFGMAYYFAPDHIMPIPPLPKGGEE